MANKHKLPPLTRISPREAECIASMFRFYDHNISGLIPRHLAVKLIISLGFGSHIADLAGANELSLRDVLLFLDLRSPDLDFPLLGAMQYFTSFVAKPKLFENDDEMNNNNNNNNNFKSNELMINTENISSFLKSIDRQTVSDELITILLQSMVDYDDCDLLPYVKSKVFEKELLNFAKKEKSLNITCKDSK